MCWIFKCNFKIQFAFDQGLTKPAEVATKASEMWKDCSPRRKKRIEGEAEKAKAEYQAAKKAYDAKQAKAGSIIWNFESFFIKFV